MKDTPALRLWRGHTVHQRSVPFEHRFKYGLALIDVDIDRLNEADQQSTVFSVDGSNLFSFNRKDHGARERAPLRPWAEQQFSNAGIDLKGGVIRLVTFPRHAFYKFAPISLWLGHGPDGALEGILYEVNNTFGETHVYVAETPDGSRHQHQTDKVFHVSPFFDVSGTYQFTLRWSDTDLRLIVATQKDGAQTHMATIAAKAQPATAASFTKLALTKPLSTLAVTLGIHWQALKLWIKGAKYHSKPKQSAVRTTIARQKNAAPEAAPRLERTA
ncbi:MAG: DUF1365 domain-containing protein [Henriciella sp.]|nr:DUF1365 domain-containing protein [Henriciella sp.]